MVGAPKTSSRYLGTLLLASFLALGGGPFLDNAVRAASPPEAGFAGKSLTEALQILQSGGLRIVFTSQVVRPEMRVESEPVATEPRAILDELLAPHGLTVRDGPGDTIVVVPEGGSDTNQSISIKGVVHEELVVTPSRVSLLRDEPGAPFVLDREELLALPHLGNDFFRALSLLPGVSSNDVTAQFHVRGGREDETQILLDGQELYESFHLQDFDNALSVIVPETVASVDLSTGGFAVEHGDRMSGVLDMRTVTPAGPPRFTLGANIWSARAGAAGAFQEQRGSWIAEARRGTADFAGRLVGRDNPEYWDAFGKVDYSLDHRHSLHFNLLHSADEFALEEVRSEESKRIETNYDTSYLWLTHQAVLSPDLFLETALSVSQVERDRQGVETEPDVQFSLRDLRDLEVLGLRQGWGLQVAAGQYLKWGFELRDFETRYDYLLTRNFDSFLAGIREETDDDRSVFLEEFDEKHLSLYFADRLDLLERLSLELGLRYDAHTQTEENLLSPRLNLAWAVDSKSVIRVAWGRFNQSQRPYELQVEDGETRFYPVERSEQRVVGYERVFETVGNPQALALRVEVYRHDIGNPRPRYENLFEAVNTFPEVEPDRIRIAPLRSLAEGVELFLRGRASRRLGWWMNYTYSRVEDQLAGGWVPRRYDQPNALNLVLDYGIGENWRLSLAWRFHTGWPTTPLTLEQVEGEGGEPELKPVVGPLFSERLPNYHRLDLRVSRFWPTRWGSVMIFADIQNVYNRENVAGFDFEIDEDAGKLIVNQEVWVGILPSLGFTIEF
jgi:hypothetical protein